MRSFRSKPVGWRGESHRHYLAAKGISTKVKLENRARLKKWNLPKAAKVYVDETTGKVVAAYDAEIGEGKAVSKKRLDIANENGIKRVTKRDGYFATKHKYYAYAPTYVAGDMSLIGADAVGTAGASVVPWIPVVVPLLMVYGGTKYMKNRKKKTGSYFAEQEDMMSFSPADLQAFDAEMKVAREQGDDQFTFKGKPVLVSYGAYLSEYLHGKFDQQHFAKKREELPSWEITQNAADKIALDEARYRQDEKMARSVEEMYPAAVTSGEFRPSMKHAKNAASAELDLGLVENILSDIEERDGEE